MSLLQLKARPLSRDKQTFRDDRLFIIACDDTYAPKQYFESFQLPRIQIHVVETGNGTSAASHVLARLLEFDHESDDERWLLLDTDHYIRATHLAAFSQTLALAKQKGIHIALSRPCFEVWLLLHRLNGDAIQDCKNAKDVEEILRATLGSYNKCKLRADDFPLSSVLEACQRAALLDGNISGGDIPDGNTSRVHLLWRSIVAKTLPTQLPSELDPLRQPH